MVMDGGDRLKVETRSKQTSRTFMIKSVVQSLQQYFQSRFQKATIVVETPDGLVELPDVLASQIAKKLREIPSPIPYQDAVQSDIKAAIEAWQQNLDAPNRNAFCKCNNVWLNFINIWS